MTLPYETLMSATTVEPASGGLSQWPTAEGNQGHITQASMPATPLGEPPPQCATPTNQPSVCLPGMEEKARKPPQVATPLTPPEEVVKPEEAEEVMKWEGAVKAEETGEVASLMTPVWTQVHPFRLVVPVGPVPHSLGDEQHCHHTHSCCSCRRTSLQAENQQSSGTGDSVPDATQGSPATTCNSSPLVPLGPSVETSKEGTTVWPWVPLPGFADIANTLLRRQSPQTPPELIEQAPTLVAGSTLFMSHMVQDAWGNLSVNMVTYQLSVMGMGTTPTATVSEMPPQGCPQIGLGSCPLPRFFLVCMPILPYPWQLSAPDFVQNCVLHGGFAQRF